MVSVVNTVPLLMLMVAVVVPAYLTQTYYELVAQLVEVHINRVKLSRLATNDHVIQNRNFYFHDRTMEPCNVFFYDMVEFIMRFQCYHCRHSVRIKWRMHERGATM